MTIGLPQLLRADAEDNKARVLEAARSLFAEQGLDVTMRAVARKAGVGPATLYRRFPTKHELVEAAFTDEMNACSTIVAEACADPDPWRGFCTFLWRIGELNAINRGFTDAFISAYPGAIDFGAHRARMIRDLAGLCKRSQAIGALRADVVVDDIIIVLMAGRGITARTPRERVLTANRFTSLAIEGFRRTNNEVELAPRAPVTAGLLG